MARTTGGVSCGNVQGLSDEGAGRFRGGYVVSTPRRYVAFMTDWRTLLVSAFFASVFASVLGVSFIGSAFSVLALDLAYHAGKARR